MNRQEMVLQALVLVLCFSWIFCEDFGDYDVPPLLLTNHMDFDVVKLVLLFLVRTIETDRGSDALKFRSVLNFVAVTYIVTATDKGTYFFHDRLGLFAGYTLGMMYLALLPRSRHDFKPRWEPSGLSGVFGKGGCRYTLQAGEMTEWWLLEILHFILGVAVIRAAPILGEKVNRVMAVQEANTTSILYDLSAPPLALGSQRVNIIGCDPVNRSMLLIVQLVTLFVPCVGFLSSEQMVKTWLVRRFFALRTLIVVTVATLASLHYAPVQNHTEVLGGSVCDFALAIDPM